MAAWVELGRSFHQLGTVKIKVRGNDCVPFIPFWDGTTCCHRILQKSC